MSDHKHVGMRNTPIEPLVCFYCSYHYDTLVKEWVTKEEFEHRQSIVEEQRKVFGSAFVARAMNAEGL